MHTNSFGKPFHFAGPNEKRKRETWRYSVPTCNKAKQRVNLYTQMNRAIINKCASILVGVSTLLGDLKKKRRKNIHVLTLYADMSNLNAYKCFLGQYYHPVKTNYSPAGRTSCHLIGIALVVWALQSLLGDERINIRVELSPVT